MRRLVVIGGGISGLAAAWTAQEAARELDGGLEVLVLEREAKVGGKARSRSVDGWVLESGPGGTLGGRPEFDRLVTACGMDGERVPARASASRRFILVNGRMREVARTPTAFARSGLLSGRGVLRLLAEPLVPRRRTLADESIEDFAERRMGREAAERLFRPMMLGIYAGDARTLSAQAALPRLVAMEREHGGLFRGLLAQRGSSRAAELTSFRRGMQSVAFALAERGGFAVRTGAEVTALSRCDHGWSVRIANDREPIAADSVILAGEPFAMAPLLREVDGRAAADLATIASAPISVVALGFRAADAPGLPNGFGVLVARGERVRALGHLWESRIYPERAPAGAVLVRALFGGQVDADAAVMEDRALLALARDEFRRLYGITAEPIMCHVHRWARAIPQYSLGHVERVARIETAIATQPGLFITGYGLHAIGFSDAAAHGARCGERAVQMLQRAPSPALAGA